MDDDLKEEKYSFEEYKLYYESTEKVTDRRYAKNKWNYSICIAVLLAIAHIWNWSVSHSEYTFIGLTALFIIMLDTFAHPDIRKRVLNVLLYPYRLWYLRSHSQYTANKSTNDTFLARRMI